VHTISSQGNCQIHDVDLLVAILLEMINHFADPRVILKDAHLLALREDRLPIDELVARILLEEGENVIDALNLPLVITQELKETFKEARFQFPDLF